MEKTLNILIIEDSEDDVLLLVRHLKKSGLDPVTQRVDTPDALRSALDAFQWDVVLCDVSMPNLDAFAALEEVKAAGIVIPFIVVSGTVPEERLVELMKAGAHDIIVKDKLSRLVPAIEREIEEAAVRRERRQAEIHLRIAIESLSEGFVLYDSQDQLVICNETHKKIYSKSADLIIPGATFEEIIRGGAERGQYEQAAGRIEEFVSERLALHQQCGEPFEQALDDGRWVLVNERRTRDGGTVGTRVDITALKTAERNLRENEAFLRLISDNLPILVAYFDREGRYRFVNRTGTQWYARPPEEILGRTVEDVLGMRAFEAFRRHHDLVREGTEQHFDTAVTYPDGVTRDVHAAYIPDREADGEIRGFVAMVADITERVSVNRELRAREEFIRAVAANVADAIIATDETGRIEAFNISAERSFGYSAEEVIGLNISMLMPGRHGARHDKYISAYLNTGHSKILGVGARELAGLRKDGSEFPLELAIAEAEVGGRRIFVGAARDISARKKTEIAIRESEERFRSAFETAPHGMALVGLDGCWLKVNRAVTEMIGYDEEELLGAEFKTVTHPDDLAAELQLGERLLNGDIPTYQTEKRIIRKDGGLVWVLSSVALVRDDDGKPLYFISQIIDLSALKHAEEEKERLERELRHAQKMEALGTLSGGIAHEFNNMLLPVAGLLEMSLEDVKDRPEVRENLQRALANANRAATLVEKILSFSRLDQCSLVDTDFAYAIDDSISLLRATIPSTVNITKDLDDVGEVRIDRSQFSQIVVNLGVNAAHAIGAAVGQLEFRLRAVTIGNGQAATSGYLGPGRYAKLTVKDSGCGMDDATTARIFEPFFTTKDIGEGTGMGLAFVHSVVKNHGGAIDVESRPGTGTSFHIFVPMDVGLQSAVSVAAA